MANKYIFINCAICSKGSEKIIITASVGRGESEEYIRVDLQEARSSIWPEKGVDHTKREEKNTLILNLNS